MEVLMAPKLLTSIDLLKKVERISKAIEWLALHRTGDEDQQQDLLAILHGSVETKESKDI